MKRKHSYFIWILCLSCSFLFLGACGQNIKISYTDVAFFEPYGETYNGEYELGICAEYGAVTYYFPQEISQEEAEAYVKETALVKKKIEKVIGEQKSDYRIYVCCEEYRTRTEEQTLYIGYDTFGQLEYVTGITQLLLGREVNYGLVYGMSVDIARSMGYEVSLGELSEAMVLYDTAPEYLDMNYACFSDYYADGDTRKNLETIAAYFYQYLKETKKTDLLAAYSAERFREYRNEFLAANGKGAYDSAELDTVFVYSGGNAFRLIWEEPEAKYYIASDFVPNQIESCLEADMLNSGYIKLRELLLTYREDIAFVREKLESYGCQEPAQASVFFVTGTEQYEAGNGGICFHSGEYAGTIHIYAEGALLHEYVHYMLADTKGLAEWLNECMAYYFSYYPSHPGLELKSDKIRTEALSPDNPEEAAEYELIQTVIKHLGHEIDWTKEEDICYLNNAYVVAYNMFGRLMSGAAPLAKLTFMSYLVDKAGERETVLALLNNTPKETFGGYWMEVMEEWEHALRAEYAWLTE